MSYWILPVSGIVISCTTVKRLTHSEKATDEWKAIMSNYDTKTSERLDVKNSDRTKQAHGIDQWNKLSIADEDPEFLEELNRVISDSSIPDGPDDKISDDKEGPTPVPGIHDQETVPSDAYVDMELGIPRGEDDILIHAIVKRSGSIHSQQVTIHLRQVYHHLHHILLHVILIYLPIFLHKNVAL